jgi:WD40 repeat protein
VLTAQFASIPDTILVSCGNNAITYNINQRSAITLYNATKTVIAAKYNKNCMQIATGSDDRLARIFSISGDLLHTLTGHKDGVRSVAFSPAGDRLVTGNAFVFIFLMKRIF